MADFLESRVLEMTGSREATKHESVIRFGNFSTKAYVLIKLRVYIKFLSGFVTPVMKIVAVGKLSLKRVSL